MAVSLAIKKGRISLTDGKIDPAKADADWDRNSRHRQPNVMPDPRAPAKVAAKLPEPPPTDDPIDSGYSGDSGDTPDIRVSRAKREAAEADIASHKAAELRGELIRRAAWERAEEKRAASVRETVLQWPAQLAAVVAAEADIARCHDILSDAVMSLLAKLSARPA